MLLSLSARIGVVLADIHSTKAGCDGMSDPPKEAPLYNIKDSETSFVVGHGDFGGGNVLLRERGLDYEIVIFDPIPAKGARWGELTRISPLVDLAKMVGSLEPRLWASSRTAAFRSLLQMQFLNAYGNSAELEINVSEVFRIASLIRADYLRALAQRRNFRGLTAKILLAGIGLRDPALQKLGEKALLSPGLAKDGK